MNMGNVIKNSTDISNLCGFFEEIPKSKIFVNLKDDKCDDFVKIFSLICLESLESLDETLVLFNHLTNHSTPVREAVAIKLEEIYDDKFFNDSIKEKLLDGIIDINPNVCRAICSLINKSERLKTELFCPLISRIKGLLEQIKEADTTLGGFYDDSVKIRKNHAKNKKLFSLYWFLEALSVCTEGKNNSSVLEILSQTIKFNDYTIREKTAKILVNMGNLSPELLQIAKNDQNFYVKNQVYVRMNFED